MRYVNIFCRAKCAKFGESHVNYCTVRKSTDEMMYILENSKALCLKCSRVQLHEADTEMLSVLLI